LKDSGEKEERLVATCLGKACLSASIPPRDGLFLFEELQRARKCLVLDTELHVVYLVTPFSPGSQISQIDWMAFLELWKTLPESERRVGQLVGVEERFLMNALRGCAKPGKAVSSLLAISASRLMAISRKSSNCLYINNHLPAVSYVPRLAISIRAAAALTRQ
jgi:hypothetical protein